MSEKPEVEAWPVWEYECPRCLEISQINGLPDSSGRSEEQCDHCRCEIVVRIPERT